MKREPLCLRLVVRDRRNPRLASKDPPVGTATRIRRIIQKLERHRLLTRRRKLMRQLAQNVCDRPRLPRDDAGSVSDLADAPAGDDQVFRQGLGGLDLAGEDLCTDKPELHLIPGSADLREMARDAVQQGSRIRIVPAANFQFSHRQYDLCRLRCRGPVLSKAIEQGQGRTIVLFLPQIPGILQGPRKEGRLAERPWCALPLLFMPLSSYVHAASFIRVAPSSTRVTRALRPSSADAAPFANFTVQALANHSSKPWTRSGNPRLGL